MGKLAQIKDGLVNLVANLGTPRDKAASTYYGLPTLSEQEADNAYRGTWLARKVIDIPAMDSCRKWRGWSADQEQITAIEAEEKRLGLQQKVLRAMIRARLTGGAALYIGTGQSDPTLPLKPESVGRAGILHINVLSKRVLQAGELDLDPESPGYGLPAFYTLSSGTAGQVRIHPSRLVILHGAEKPDPELGTGNGWGDSVLLAISKAIKDADASAANIASLVFEAKVDVIKIPNFMSSLADPEYEQKVLQRLTLAAMAKGVNGALLLDAEEEYEQKQAQFGGLVDLMMGFMQLTSGASDIPMTRLLGQSPGGLNASGESDLRNYYDRISSNQELVLQPALPDSGRVPDPLRAGQPPAGGVLQLAQPVADHRYRARCHRQDHGGDDQDHRRYAADPGTCAGASRSQHADGGRRRARSGSRDAGVREVGTGQRGRAGRRRAARCRHAAAEQQ
ncbi:anti-CBASS Acb1 family protein [Stenotrophomonas maltophilia]